MTTTHAAEPFAKGPARGGSFTHAIGRTWLAVFGWTLDSIPPPVPKFVVVAAPHTSGWDLPFMLATSWSMRVPIAWMGKHTLFAPPFGWFMKALGGIPIDRRARHNVVAWAIDTFAQSEFLALAVPAEATRAKVEFWKSGFYRIAHGANVPVALAYLDFEKKKCGVGAYLTLTGDVRADMEKIRAFYADVRAKFPEDQGIPRLREEDVAAVVEQVAAVMA